MSKKKLINILLTSKTLNASVLATIKYVIKQIKERIIKNKEKELIGNIKSNYKELSIKKLNKNLEIFLNPIDIDRASLEEATRLIIAGADINTKNEYGNTALIEAARKGYKYIVELLLNKGANHDIENKLGCTALMLAAKKGYIEIVKLILNKGADINIKDKYGYTALILAASKGHIDIVILLLNKGANTDIQSNNGHTALILAESRGYTDIVKLIKAKTNQGNNFCLVS